MATELSATNAYPFFKVVSVGTTATEIIIPEGARKVTLGASSALYVAQNGGTDGGTMPADKAFVTASNYLELTFKYNTQRATSIFVAAQTGTASVSIILE